MVNTPKEVSWEAAEYIVRSHNVWWYLGLFAIGIALCALAVYMNWWTFLVLIILSIVAILVSTMRPPRTIKYSINKTGLTEAGKLHNFDEFKAFGILKEGSHFSAILIPKKRFGLQVKVYFPEGSGEAIVDLLGAHLPMEEVRLDFLDKIVNFLRI